MLRFNLHAAFVRGTAGLPFPVGERVGVRGDGSIDSL
jgi:hypothetical protein